MFTDVCTALTALGARACVPVSLRVRESAHWRLLVPWARDLWGWRPGTGTAGGTPAETRLPLAPSRAVSSPVFPRTSNAANDSGVQ